MARQAAGEREREGEADGGEAAGEGGGGEASPALCVCISHHHGDLETQTSLLHSPPAFSRPGRYPLSSNSVSHSLSVSLYLPFSLSLALLLPTESTGETVAGRAGRRRRTRGSGEEAAHTWQDASGGGCHAKGREGRGGEEGCWRRGREGGCW